MPAGAARVAGVIEATIAAMQRLGATPASDSGGDRTLHRAGLVRGRARICGMPYWRASHRTIATSRPASARARWQFDLAGYCAGLLASAGIRLVEVIGADTAADEARFFSHRRRTLGGGGPIGHQISIIALNPG